MFEWDEDIELVHEEDIIRLEKKGRNIEWRKKIVFEFSPKMMTAVSCCPAALLLMLLLLFSIFIVVVIFESSPIQLNCYCFGHVYWYMFWENIQRISYWPADSNYNSSLRQKYVFSYQKYILTAVQLLHFTNIYHSFSHTELPIFHYPKLSLSLDLNHPQLFIRCFHWLPFYESNYCITCV